MPFTFAYIIGIIFNFFKTPIHFMKANSEKTR
jgi:hypothetical protein